MAQVQKELNTASDLGFLDHEHKDENAWSKSKDAQKDSRKKQSEKKKNPSNFSGWIISEEMIEKEAYRLWEAGFSLDSLSNWFEAERLITESLSQ